MSTKGGKSKAIKPKNDSDSDDEPKSKHIKAKKVDKVDKSDIDKLSSIMSVSPFGTSSQPKKKEAVSTIRNVKIDLETDSQEEIIKKLVQKIEYLEQELNEFKKYADDTYYTYKDNFRNSDTLDKKIEEKIKDIFQQ
jgi:hypothetical protein